jgi:hypothetical protein
MLALSAGCRSVDFNARVFHPWGCEDLEDARAHFDAHKHVFMICIYEDQWQDQGLNRYSLHHSKATVVRVYRGDWRISDRIAFVQGLDYPALATTNANAGSLGFVFTDQHADTEIGLDTGEFVHYRPELETALDLVYPQSKSR